MVNVYFLNDNVITLSRKTVITLQFVHRFTVSGRETEAPAENLIQPPSSSTGILVQLKDYKLNRRYRRQKAAVIKHNKDEVSKKGGSFGHGSLTSSPLPYWQIRLKEI